MDRPSGLTTGSATRFISQMSSCVTGRFCAEATRDSNSRSASFLMFRDYSCFVWHRRSPARKAEEGRKWTQINANERRGSSDPGDTVEKPAYIAARCRQLL